MSESGKSKAAPKKQGSKCITAGRRVKPGSTAGAAGRWLERVHEISRIAARLTENEDVSEALAASLAEIGRLYGATGVDLNVFDRQTATAITSHRWQAPVEGRPAASSHSDEGRKMSWLGRKIRKGEPFIIESVADFPASAAAERQEFNLLGLSSRLYVPLPFAGHADRYISFDNVLNAFEPLDEYVAGLNIYAAVVAASLKRHESETKQKANESRYRKLFESSPTALWDLDYSDIIDHFAELRRSGVTDFRQYFDENPGAVMETTAKLNIKDVNKATLDLFGADSKEDFLNGLGTVFTEESFRGFKEELIAFANGQSRFEGENVAQSLDGRRVDVAVKTFALGGHEKTMSQVFCAITDITERKKAEAILRASETKYRTLVESASDAIFVSDAETGIISDANRQAEKLLGRPAGEIVGRHRVEFCVHREARQYEQILLDHIKSAAKETLLMPPGFDLHVLTKDGSRVPVEISARVVEMGDKRIVLSIFRDTTERQRQRQLQDVLHKINSVINSSLHFDHIVQEVLVEAARGLSAETAITLMSDGEYWVVKSVFNHPEEILDTRFKKRELAWVGHAAGVRKPVSFSDLPASEQRASALANQFDVKSGVAVPLIVRDEIIGCLAFCHGSETVQFRYDQMDFARQLGASTSMALENARLYAEKRNIADALQQSLLTMPKEISGINFGNLYRSATKATRVSGDFYDIFELGEDRVGLIVGDVSGKGLEAAKLTSLVKNTIRAYAAEGHSPARVMARTNELTLAAAKPQTFVTVFFAVLDKRTGQLRFCSAGHPPAIIKSGDEARFITQASPAVSVLPELTFESERVALQPGEILFIYTDGATDARGPQGFFGEDRLRAVVAAARCARTEQLPHVVFGHLLDFAAGELRDDLALLSVSLA